MNISRGYCNNVPAARIQLGGVGVDTGSDYAACTNAIASASAVTSGPAIGETRRRAATWQCQCWGGSRYWW